MNSIMTFLGENDGKEEDPILLVNYLPQLTAEDPNSVSFFHDIVGKYYLIYVTYCI